MPPTSWNNRREHRRDGYGTLLRWRSQSSRTKRRCGWLNDISTNGLSFLVPSQHHPQVGESVEVVSKTDGQTNACRVLRLESLEGNLTLVGCRKAPLTPGPGAPGPARPSAGPQPGTLSEGNRAAA